MNQRSPDPGVGPVGQTGIIVALPDGIRSFQVKVFGDVWEVVDNSLSSQQSAELQIGTSVRVTAVAGNKITIQKI
jgi:membrane protein implicated in regulation of membrane protease activity